MSYIRDVLKYLFLLAVVAGVIFAGKSFSCARVDYSVSVAGSESGKGSLRLLDKRPVKAAELQIGDIICFEFSSGEKALTWAGRIIALPGSTFESDGGTVVIDGRLQAKGFAASLETLVIPNLLVPTDHLLVAFESTKGRTVPVEQHLVPCGAIRGRVIR